MSTVAAEILETGASGYAGMAASLLFERHPEIEKKYGRGAFSNWKAQFRQWLLDLSASVDTGEPALFESRIRWTRRAFSARGNSVDSLEAGLTALRDILKEKLPDSSTAEVLSIVDSALAIFAKDEAPAEAALDPTDANDRLALSYLQTTLEGDPRGAMQPILDGVGDPHSVKNAYINVLLPALREVGRMWHAGELSISEEHLITTTTQRLMALLCERARPASSSRPTAVLACVEGNTHEIAIRATSDFFDMAGWRAINLGSDVPADDIANSVLFFEADLLVLGLTLATHLKTARQAIRNVRSLEGRDVKIIVGGQVFTGAPELWRELDADGYSPSVEATEALASRLVGTT